MSRSEKIYRSLQSDLNSLLLDMRMDSSYTLVEAVDVLIAMAKHYEKHGADYKRIVKYYKEFVYV